MIGGWYLRRKGLIKSYLEGEGGEEEEEEEDDDDDDDDDV
jgi:hypothetical protein